MLSSVSILFELGCDVFFLLDEREGPEEEEENVLVCFDDLELLRDGGMTATVTVFSAFLFGRSCLLVQETEWSNFGMGPASFSISFRDTL